MKWIFSLLAVVLACAAANLNAQDTAVKEEADVPNYRPFTLSVEASSTGPGLAADWRFADHFGARVGFNGFFGDSIDIGTHAIEGNSYNTSLKLMSEPLALDIYPWRTSAFRITVGILLNQNELGGEGVPAYNNALHIYVFYFDGVGYPAGENGIGGLNLTLEQPAVAPYLSIGMKFHLDKQRHWSIGGELGVAYTGTPDVSLSTTTGAEATDSTLLGAMNAEAQQIEDTAWKVYPIVKVSVNYSF